MKFAYFYEQPILNGYRFSPQKGFKHGVEISFYDRDEYGDYYETYEYFLLELIDFLFRTYDHDRKRYEFLMDDEHTLYRVYFRDEADQVAFKLLWGGEWDKEPVYEDEE